MSNGVLAQDPSAIIMDDKAVEEAKVEKTVSFANIGVKKLWRDHLMDTGQGSVDYSDESRVASRESLSEHDADDEDDVDSDETDDEESSRQPIREVQLKSLQKTLSRKRSSNRDGMKSRRKSAVDEGRRNSVKRSSNESNGTLSRNNSETVATEEGGDDEQDDSDGNVELEAKARNPKIVDTSPTGRYVRFNELLGEGSFKKVYLAYDTQQGVEVAWNMVKVSRLAKSAQQRIVQEMQILQTLNHEHIIKFYASWLIKDTQSVVFVTEMMSSGTLKDFIQKRPIRLRIVKRWCRHILAALIYLHEENEPAIIHRDLKCDNIFINGGDGSIRIGDMGLASWQRNGNAKSVLGTPEYMAPEMFEESYDEKVDIYAFGMCILEMITKETPYLECTSTPQIYKRVMDGMLPEAYHSIIDCPAKSFIDECIRTPQEGSTRPSASELRSRQFLRKKDKDPTDDIDCKELLKDTQGRLNRLEKKNSTCSLAAREENAEEGKESVNTSVQKNQPDALETKKTEHHVYFQEEKEKVNELGHDYSPMPTKPNSSAPNARNPEKPNSNGIDSDSESGGSDIVKGADVEARFGGDGDWFGGKIHKVNKDGTFGIKYQDHDYEDSVSPDFIRISGEDGQMVPLSVYLSVRQQEIAEMKSSENARLSQHSSSEHSAEQKRLSRPPSSRSLASESDNRHDASNNVYMKSSDAVSQGSDGSPPLRPQGADNLFENGVPRWSMVAKNAGDDSTPKSELTILFSYFGGPSAMFPFDIDHDQASAVASELVETLKLPASELDNIALNLLQFRHEYETWRFANPDSEFRLTVERDQNTRIQKNDNPARKQMNGSIVTEANKEKPATTQVEDDSEKTDDEIADLDRQIRKEQETYRQIQAQHEERINRIKNEKKRKEERKSQQQRQFTEAGQPSSIVDGRGRASSSYTEELGGDSSKIKIMAESKPSDQIGEQKTKDQLRKEAAKKIEAEKKYIRQKKAQESQILEAKINRLEGFTLNDPGTYTPAPIGVPSAVNQVAVSKIGLTLNEKRHKHQLDALEKKQKAIQVQATTQIDPSRARTLEQKREMAKPGDIPQALPTIVGKGANNGVGTEIVKPGIAPAGYPSAVVAGVPHIPQTLPQNVMKAGTAGMGTVPAIPAGAQPPMNGHLPGHKVAPAVNLECTNGLADEPQVP